VRISANNYLSAISTALRRPKPHTYYKPRNKINQSAQHPSLTPTTSSSLSKPYHETTTPKELSRLHNHKSIHVPLYSSPPQHQPSIPSHRIHHTHHLPEPAIQPYHQHSNPSIVRGQPNHHNLQNFTHTLPIANPRRKTPRPANARIQYSQPRPLQRPLHHLGIWGPKISASAVQGNEYSQVVRRSSVTIFPIFLGQERYTDV
jgi:hypothetical protein